MIRVACAGVCAVRGCLLRECGIARSPRAANVRFHRDARRAFCGRAALRMSPNSTPTTLQKSTFLPCRRAKRRPRKRRRVRKCGTSAGSVGDGRDSRRRPIFTRNSSVNDAYIPDSHAPLFSYVCAYVCMPVCRVYMRRMWKSRLYTCMRARVARSCSEKNRVIANGQCRKLRSDVRSRPDISWPRKRCAFFQRSHRPRLSAYTVKNIIIVFPCSSVCC